MKKIDIVKVVNIVGTVLGIASTLLSGWAGQKATKDTIAEQVAEALANQTKKH